MTAKDKHEKRIILRTFIDNYLLTHHCVGVSHHSIKCDETDPCCLEFDHIDPATKKFTISEGIRLAVTLAQLKAEISKCCIRCSNCHKKRHSKDK